MSRKSPYIVTLSAEQRVELEARARRYTLPYRDVVRAKIVLMAAAGFDNDEIAARLDTRREIVSKWRRGKIHERDRQGRMASSDSHRQIVVPEMSAAMPRARTSLAMSGTCRRDNGTPRRDGSSQARALTATTTSGGTRRGSATPGAFLQAGQSLFEEALADPN